MTDTTTRNTGLRQMLDERRRDAQDDLQIRLRHGRNGRSRDGHDGLEQSDADSQGEIAFTLLEMRAATLMRIDRALARLDAGDYGTCAECRGEIAEPRLRALPFAARCWSCEQQREQEQRQLRQLARRDSSLSLFASAI